MTQEKDKIVCEICGEPMPEGETMFKFHGYSGPCPKPPLEKQPQPVEKELQAARLCKGAKATTMTTDTKKHDWEAAIKEFEPWLNTDLFDEKNLIAAIAALKEMQRREIKRQIIKEVMSQ